MNDAPPATQGKTLAIILGAHDWPNMGGRLKASDAFSLSAAAFKAYLQDEGGLNLPGSSIKDLFDEDLSNLQTDQAIRTFLRGHYQDGVPTLDNVIIYYCGHGDFTKGEQHFQLMLRSTNEEQGDFSTYQMRQLAATVNAAARPARKIALLDCCYAAAAFQDWQFQSDGDVKQSVRLQARADFPDPPNQPAPDAPRISGTALICACDQDQWALYNDGDLTMFIAGLMQTLREGDPERGPVLSVGDLYELVRICILSTHKNEAVAPFLHIARGPQEDMRATQLFPNAARRIDPTIQRLLALEAYIARMPAEVSAQATDAMRPTIAQVNAQLADIQKALEQQQRANAEIRKAAEEALRRSETQADPRSSAEDFVSAFIRVPTIVWANCPDYVRRAYLDAARGRSIGTVFAAISFLLLCAALITSPAQIFGPPRSQALVESDRNRSSPATR